MAFAFLLICEHQCSCVHVTAFSDKHHRDDVMCDAKCSVMSGVRFFCKTCSTYIFLWYIRTLSYLNVIYNVCRCFFVLRRKSSKRRRLVRSASQCLRVNALRLVIFTVIFCHFYALRFLLHLSCTDVYIVLYLRAVSQCMIVLYCTISYGFKGSRFERYVKLFCRFVGWDTSWNPLKPKSFLLVRNSAPMYVSHLHCKLIWFP